MKSLIFIFFVVNFFAGCTSQLKESNDIDCFYYKEQISNVFTLEEERYHILKFEDTKGKDIYILNKDIDHDLQPPFKTFEKIKDNKCYPLLLQNIRPRPLVRISSNGIVMDSELKVIFAVNFDSNGKFKDSLYVDLYKTDNIYGNFINIIK